MREKTIIPFNVTVILKRIQSLTGRKMGTSFFSTISLLFEHNESVKEVSMWMELWKSLKEKKSSIISFQRKDDYIQISIAKNETNGK